MELLVKRIAWKRSNAMTGNQENQKKLKTGKQSKKFIEKKT